MEAEPIDELEMSSPPSSPAEVCLTLEEVYSRIGADSPEVHELRAMVARRHWLHESTMFDEQTGELLPTSLSGFCEQVLATSVATESSTKDRLQRVIDHVRQPLIAILHRPGEKLLREQAMVPIRAVRELDTSCLMALSRRPGRTIREKLAGRPYMQAIRRRPTVDTTENRLMKALACRLIELLRLRMNCFPESEQPENVELLWVLESWLRGPDVEGIGQWQHLPPNNNLLQHRDYQRLWRGWCWLQAIDDDLREDHRKRWIHWKQILFWEVVARLRECDGIRIAEQPVFPEYDRLEILPGLDSTDGTFCLPGCIVREGESRTPSNRAAEPIMIRLTGDGTIEIDSKGKERRVLAAFSSGDKERVLVKVADSSFDVSIDPDGAKCAATKAVPVRLHVKDVNGRNTSRIVSTHAVIDLTRLRPRFHAEEGKGMLRSRLLWQLWQLPQRLAHEIDLGTSDAVVLDSCATTVSILDLVSDERREETAAGVLSRAARHFSQTIQNELGVRPLTYLIPDATDDFSPGLEALRTSLNARFPEADPLPRSIAAIFKWQSSSDFASLGIRKDDSVIVLDAVGGIVSATPLVVGYNKNLTRRLPESRGIYWERCPTIRGDREFSPEKMCEEALDGYGCPFSETLGELCGLQGIIDGAGRISWRSRDGAWFSLPETLKKWHPGSRMHTARAWDSLRQGLMAFLNDIPPTARIFLISTDDAGHLFEGSPPREILAGRTTGQLMSVRNPGGGGLMLRNWQAAAGQIPLWRDRLPELSMRIFVNGRFSLFHLVKDAAPIVPRRDVALPIPIREIFRLPPGLAQYRFPLVRGREASGQRYEALLESPAFPLRENDEEKDKNTPCRLHLTFTYGADKPYDLRFQPLFPDKAGFKEVGVQWRRVDVSDDEEQIVPEFPQRLGWEDLRCFPLRGGSPVDLLAMIQKPLKRYPPRTNGTIYTDWHEGGFCFVKSAQGDVFCHIRSFSEDTKERRPRIGDVVYFDMTEGAHGRLRCENTSFTAAEPPSFIVSRLRDFDRDIRSRVSAMLVAWSHGHHLGEPDAPPELREPVDLMKRRCLHLLSASVEDYESDEIEEAMQHVRDSAFYALCCLGADSPDEVFQMAGTMAESDFSRNWRKIGLLIGNVEQARQKELFQLCIDGAASGSRQWMQVLGIAVWRAEIVVHQTSAEKLASICSHLAQMLEWDIGNTIRRNSSTGESFVSPYTIIRLELCLGLLRSRGSTEKAVRALLAVGSPLCRRLESIVGKIDRIILDSGLEVRSRLSLKLPDKPKSVRSHDLVYAVMASLTGDTGANAISVTGIDDNE